MNEKFKMTYLSGGDGVFGPNYGGAAVYTAVANGYLERCPNVGTLIRNLKFGLSMESQVMAPILQKRDPVASALDWLRANPAVLRSEERRVGKDCSVRGEARVERSNIR